VDGVCLPDETDADADADTDADTDADADADVDTGTHTDTGTFGDTGRDTGSSVDTGPVEDTGSGEDTGDTGATPVVFEDADGDGHTSDVDCNDFDPETHPGADERCNDRDDDCDGEIDEEVMDTWYEDADGDGYGDETLAVSACTLPAGYAGNDDDCDDTDAAVHPGAIERCDDTDDDCNGEIDDGAIDAGHWYADEDEDGHGDPAASAVACDPPTGTVANDEDCDDADGTIHPGADELCNDSDDDCDGSVDELATDMTTWYADLDGDGHPGSSLTVTACEAPDGYGAESVDCDDLDDSTYPEAEEVCDGADNDCDEEVDEGVTSTWYQDDDGDSYGDPDSVTEACSMPPDYVANDDDCDDDEPSVHPGGVEICDGLDNDCNGEEDDDALGADSWYADTDADGFGDAEDSVEACSAPASFVADATDCDDGDTTIHTDAEEVCDEVDNNCDGVVDEDLKSTWYRDDDEDSYGDAFTTTEACDPPEGFVGDATDCDDGDTTINTDAEEVCDDVDNNCDGEVDEDLLITWYRDADVDSYGDALTPTERCEMPPGYVADTTDCDDSDGTVYPGAVDDWYDGIDADCAGDSDHDADADGHDTTESGGDDRDDDDLACWDTCLDGGSDHPGLTCGQILDDYPSAVDAIYWIDTDDDGDSTDDYQVYCDMSGGGWTQHVGGAPWSLNYTGGTQVLTTVGIEVDYRFKVYGAAGGTGEDNNGGYGGMASGVRTFAANTTLVVVVGGRGESGGGADTGTCDRVGGYNGGGSAAQGGSGGGGGTDIRLSPGDHGSRIIVGGGGGGCGNENCDYYGGAGGGLTGGSGEATGSGHGFGGSQVAGGTNTTSTPVSYGAFGVGGNRASCNDEGGGGGGWFGGSAGGIANGMGGGGSSYYGGMDYSQVTEAGVNSGHGYVEYSFR
jgi:hypothetical protein